LTNITSKDRERFPTIFFVPIAVEKCKALLVESFQLALNVIDDLGREESFAGAS